jgi:hypothetical protein
VLRGEQWHEVPRSPRFAELDLAWLCSFLDRTSMTEAIRDLQRALLLAAE